MKNVFIALSTFVLTYSTLAQEKILDSANFSIQNTTINTTGDEIAPILSDGHLYFLSEKNSDFAEHLNIFTLKKAKIGEDGKPFSAIRINEIFGLPSTGGPIVISEDGTKAIYAKEVHIKHTKSKEKFKFFLFSTEKDSTGKWTTPIQLPFDDEHYSCSHPTLNKDFTKMYFVSDNQEGKGGADIWYTELKNGKWQKPIDLGEKINTDGKEIFPYLYDENTLFFASNHHQDSEGLDIYMAKVTGPQINSISRLPSPINGPENDFSLTFSKDRRKGFFCSNRNLQSGDDIFQFILSSDNLSKTNNSSATSENKTSTPLSSKEYTEFYNRLINDRNDNKCVTLDISSGLDIRNKNLGYRWKFSDGDIKDGIRVTKCFAKRDKYATSLYTVDKESGYELFEKKYPINISNKEIKIDIKDSFWNGEKLDINYNGNEIVNAIWTIDGLSYLEKQPNITFQKTGTIKIQGLVSSNGSPLNFTEVNTTITVKESILKDVNFSEVFNVNIEESHSFYLNDNINLKSTNSVDSTSESFQPIGLINMKSKSFKENTSYKLSVWSANQFSTEIEVNTKNNTQLAINNGLKELSKTDLTVIKPIFFKLNSETEPEDTDAINQLIQQLKQIPNSTLEIGSYTHSDGDITQNSKLSIARSEFIKKQLIKAIPSLSIKIANPTENISLQSQNALLNRRTDIKIISL